jgi:hypothetical protein
MNGQRYSREEVGMAIELYRMGWTQPDIAVALGGHRRGINSILRREISQHERIELKRKLVRVSVSRAARKRRINKNRIRLPSILTMKWGTP